MCRSGHDATCVVTGGISTVHGTPSKLEASDALLQPERGNTLGSGVNTAGGSVPDLMANLLPQANLGLAEVPRCLCQGASPPVSTKLAAKIKRGEFTEMAHCYQSFGPPSGRMTTTSRRPSPGGPALCRTSYVAAVLRPVHERSGTPAPIKYPRVQLLCGLARITRAWPGNTADANV